MDEWFSLRMPTWALEAALVAEILQGTEHLQVEAGTIVELTGQLPRPKGRSLQVSRGETPRMAG